MAVVTKLYHTTSLDNFGGKIICMVALAARFVY